MTAYYNENNPYAAEWLRNLIAAGHIAAGDVDTRSIEDVHPDDLRSYTQCHFFAGIGVWSYALRQAGWPDNRPVWTGSCPCQPFSSAGKGAAFADERHLWPAFHWLIQERKPATVFGEQVASKDADDWIDLVQADLEVLGYAFGVVPFPSAGIGAPHIRDRNFWVGYTQRKGLERHGRNGGDREKSRRNRAQQTGSVAEAGSVVWMADAESEGLPHRGTGRAQPEPPSTHGSACTARPGSINGFWRDADWLFCRDGKWRPVEPGTQPLAHGIANRVGRLRAYGNAINSQAAKAFIEVAMECLS